MTSLVLVPGTTLRLTTPAVQRPPGAIYPAVIATVEHNVSGCCVSRLFELIYPGRKAQLFASYEDAATVARGLNAGVRQ